MAASRRDALINLAIAAGAVCAFLLVLQLVLSWWPRPEHGLHARSAEDPDRRPRIYEGIYRASLDEVLEWEPAPGANGVVNPAGYVGPERRVEKPAGTFRIIGLGDSITMGVEPHNYLAVLEARLAASGARPVEVLNLAVGGYDTRQEVRRLERLGLRYRPDLVIVGYCLNDGFDERLVLNDLTGRIAIDPQPGGDRARSPALLAFLERGAATARSALTRGQFEQRVFASAQWKESVGALERLRGLAHEHEFSVLLVLFPFLLDAEADLLVGLHARLVEEGTQLGFGVIDLQPAFRASGMDNLRIDDPSDYIHPNAAGHAITAAEIASFIERDPTWAADARAAR